MNAGARGEDILLLGAGRAPCPLALSPLDVIWLLLSTIPDETAEDPLVYETCPFCMSVFV